MGFNKEQLKAINSVGNVIVSAGAGSGKTSVLTTRISNHLLSDTKLDEILILYTILRLYNYPIIEKI